MLKTAVGRIVRRLRDRGHTFDTDEAGAATVEAVIWMPVFLAVFILVVDSTMIFSNRAQALRVIQDANRSVVLGRFGVDGAMDFVRGALGNMSPGLQVETVVEVDDDLDVQVVVTRLLMPASDLDATGLLTNFTDFQISLAARQVTEL